jgi:hypothetical protein
MMFSLLWALITVTTWITPKPQKGKQILDSIGLGEGLAMGAPMVAAGSEW